MIAGGVKRDVDAVAVAADEVTLPWRGSPDPVVRRPTADSHAASAGDGHRARGIGANEVADDDVERGPGIPHDDVGVMLVAADDIALHRVVTGPLQ